MTDKEKIAAYDQLVKLVAKLSGVSLHRQNGGVLLICEELEGFEGRTLAEAVSEATKEYKRN